MADEKKSDSKVAKSQSKEAEPERIKFTVTEPITFQFRKNETTVNVVRGQTYTVREKSTEGQPEISKVDRTISRQKADWAISENKAEKVKA